MKITKNHPKFVASFVAIVLVCIVALFLQIGYFFRMPLSLTQNRDFLVPEGASVTRLAWQLKRDGVLKQPRMFILWARLAHQDGHIKAGDYLLNKGITAPQLLIKLSSGDMLYRGFTIIEGWTFHDLIRALEKDSNLKHTLQGLSDAEIMTKIGHQGETSEGRFFPETYLFSVGAKDTQVLRRSYAFMQQQLNRIWQTSDANKYYKCPYEALIVASMVQKEGAVKEELPKIAGIILQRLKIRMPLQIDASVIYGLGDTYTGKLRRKDLELDTPYNLYLHYGLPPTPIALPGLDALQASLNPVISSDLYYVAKRDGSGRHKFSSTFKQQRAAIKKYLLGGK